MGISSCGGGRAASLLMLSVKWGSKVGTERVEAFSSMSGGGTLDSILERTWAAMPARTLCMLSCFFRSALARSGAFLSHSQQDACGESR